MQCTCHLVCFTSGGYIWSQNAMYMSSCALYIWGYIWSHNAMYMSSCALDIWGVYLISECNVHVILCALHLGGISDLRMQCTCHLVHFTSGGISLIMQCTCHLVCFTSGGYIWSQNAMYMSSCALYIWGYIWSHNAMYMSSCALDIWGVYLISECNVHVILCTWHLGGISDLIMQCTCHLVHFTSGGYIWSQNALHMKSLLSLLILWALEHCTM